MSIHPHYKALNDRLTRLERCVEEAPAEMFERAREAAHAVGCASNNVLYALLTHGFQTSNGDKLRELEAAIYGYLLAANPTETELAAAEGYGEHIDGPAGDRVRANVERDAAFIAGQEKR